MSTDPNINTDIPNYYQQMVAVKQQAGMDLPTAQDVATAQILSDAKSGLLNRDSAIQWLIAREVEKGSPPETAQLWINQRMGT